MMRVPKEATGDEEKRDGVRKPQPTADPTPRAKPKKEKDAHPQFVSEKKGHRLREVSGSTTVVVEQDPRVFASNLGRLTRMNGLNCRAAAEKVGATHLWYRRAVSKGLTRISKPAQPIFEKIVELFRLTRPEDLWEPDLIRFENTKSISGNSDAHAHLLWRQKEWWPWARKLAHILASGKHEYIKDMIDTLYKSVPKDNFKEPEPGASFWSSDEDETE